jgi:hypothetical protein
MAPTAVTVNDMLNTLNEEDYRTAISFIQYLADTRKKKNSDNNQKILSEIQGMFAEEKGWDSEEEMIADMARFRKERTAL